MPHEQLLQDQITDISQHGQGNDKFEIHTLDYWLISRDV
jgi:hypothetical protein